MGQVFCFCCGETQSFTDRLGFREECDKCHADLHVCKNCVFYDETSYNECREPTVEVVREKERSNYCDHFSPGSQKKQKNNADQLKAAAEALFKKM